MSIEIHGISWHAGYVQLDYTSDGPEALWLYRLKSRRFVPFHVVWSDGNRYRAQLNVVLGGGREVLPAGEWRICRRIDDDLLADLDTLLKAKPYLWTRIRYDARRRLPKALRNDDMAIAEKIRELGVSLIVKHPYDTHGITYSADLLSRIDNLDRVFRYGRNRYAYAGVFVPKTNRDGEVYLALDMLFYQRNKTPRRRSGSKRQRQKDIFAFVYSMMTRVVPRKRNRILFLKENGDGPTENMAALQRRMHERGMDRTFDIRCRYRNVFSGRQKLLPWLGDLLAIARSRYIFVDDYTPVFNFIDPGDDVTLTQIWHAGVGFKSVGYARFGLKGSPDPYNSAHRRYTYALVGNEHLRTIYSEVFGIEEEALLATGMPRLDHFLDPTVERGYRQEMLDKYPWAGKGKRVIVFAPTFRGTGQRTAYYPYDAIDMDRLYLMCVETDSYFVFEMHHFIKRRPQIPEEYADRILDLSDESLTKLFFIADVLVTDYSSCFYDYLLLGKPVVFFVPDKTAYSLIRGVQRSIDEMAPGTICDTFDDFMDVLEHRRYETVKPHPSSIDRAAERGMLASDRAIDAIIYRRDVPGVRLRPADAPAVTDPER
ncbi:CDP-glycerol glycerophosphotransferase family protein [Bifidobacterium amazonense]|uniref:CDP-glycerol glycerophosphotransferase family protein n=1 Tax=Bifidobacterium amazonense TaxID=2809027 RepID=A0ABS9VTR9_9BIFI|nr:CDP-glycerol glycerophosphotransferase family protein [Bifidobacterium amazonense]MCH9275498.1 CDP-glycerol glycerophosphotransferase family protein [Bifidobacterium amazonense]